MTAETITKTAYLNGVKRTVPYGYAINDVVATPNSSYTVGDFFHVERGGPVGPPRTPKASLVGEKVR